MEYVAPELSDVDITGALQIGLLGDSIRHLTVEQLKNPSSGLVLQVCVSILDKLGVEIDHLGQSLPNRPILDPEIYRPNLMRMLNVTKLLNHCVPGLLIETKDILYPKWKRIRRLLNIFINYLRYWEYNISTWKEISSDSEDLLKKREELLNQNSKLETVLQDTKNWLKQNESHYVQQRLELADWKEKFEKILDQQKDKDKEKVAAKLEMSKTTERFEIIKKELARAFEEKEQVSLQVVSSPEKLLAEKKSLLEKKDELQEDFQKHSNILRDTERKIERVNQTHELAKFDLQLLSDCQTFIDDLHVIKDNAMKKKFEIDTMSLSKSKLSKEIENLKQELVTSREQLHRIKLRAEKQSQSHKQQLADYTKELETMQSSLKSSEVEVRSTLQELDEQKKSCMLKHQATIEKLQEKEKMLWQNLDEIEKQTVAYFESIVGSKCSEVYNF
uniref:Optineurin-like n=1 Tax=Phallusia mammillata TaxID=59560 RepID=A0A6F9DN07_9ASCI|nr:optineurin-like [Phallusia mammillata]